MYKLWIVIMILIFVIAGLVIYISANTAPLVEQVEQLQETNGNLEELVQRKDFAWATADMEVDNLEQIVTSQAFMVRQATIEYTSTKLTNVLLDEMLEYSLVYIQWLQVRMAQEGLHYPEFIIDSVLSDDFYEDNEG